MQTCVILSNLETSTLPLVSSLAEKEEELSLILLSDAAFFLNDSENEDFFDYLEQNGVNIYLTYEDRDKRGIQTNRDLQIISYETLVEILLSENTKVYNF